MTSPRTPVTPLALAVGAAVLALSVGFVVGRYAFRPESVTRRSDDGAPNRKDVRVVVARGRLEPDGGVINVGVAGDRLQSVAVSEGQLVSTGDKLAVLDSHPDRLAEYNLAKIQLDDARRRQAAVKEACDCAIEEAIIRKEQVEKVEPLDIQAQDARVRLLVEQLANAHRPGSPECAEAG